MKINYADRRTDTNILEKKFIILDTNDDEFRGKISLIDIKDLNKSLVVTRPDNSKDLVIDKDYKILTYFPINESYCMTAMYDNNLNLKQWYFDMVKPNFKYDNGIPYSEDLYLDLVVLPDGIFYSLDEDEIKDALSNNLISKDEFDIAYKTMNKVIKIVKENFFKLEDFTKRSLEHLMKNIED